MRPIGGLDANLNSVIVELDESLFFQRKYHRGGHAENHWVFGGVERDDQSNIFLVTLPMVANQPQRTANILLPLIQQWCLPGTHIMTDGWPAYGGISNLPQGYLHDVVVHQQHFVDPNNPIIHTQGIEGGVWSVLKQKIRSMHGTSDALFESYLAEFIFRCHFPEQNTFGNILFYIRHYYPV